MIQKNSFPLHISKKSYMILKVPDKNCVFLKKHISNNMKIFFFSNIYFKSDFEVEKNKLSQSTTHR